MPNSNKDLAKTLASRLKFELCPHEMKMNSQLNCVKCVEAVIREAIEKARQSERELANKTIQAMYKVAVRGHSPDDVLRVLKALLTEAEMDADAIRSLKQSNSGRAEQGDSEGVK